MIVALLPYSVLGYAFEPTLSGFFEAGNRNTIEAIEIEDTLAYDYSKYCLKYDYPIKKLLNLALKYSSYAKEYENRKESNNDTISIRSYWDFAILARKDSSIELDVDLGWRKQKLSLAAEYEWKLKDYELRPNEVQNAGRVSIGYKF